MEKLYQIALAENPRLEALRRAIDVQRKALELARKDYYPDVALGGLRDTGRSGPVMPPMRRRAIMIELNLHIWREKLRAQVEESRSLILKAKQKLESAKDKTLFKLKEAYLIAMTSYEIAKAYAEEIIPQARQALKVSQADYIAGKASFIDWIDNWRRLLEFEIAKYISMSAYEQSIAELELSAGIDLRAGP